MINRLLKWFGFSVGFMILPVIISVITHNILQVPVSFEEYLSEILFMSVTLTATSIGDIVSLVNKRVNGTQITIFLILLIMIALICISAYVIISVGQIKELTIDYKFVKVLTICSGIASLLISGSCQAFLSKVVRE